jgi:transcriptional regulator with XRE-family HTH domain
VSRPFGAGPHVMGEATERAALAAWIAVTESPEWTAAAELRLLMAVDPEVIARRKAELNALLAGDELEPTKGFTWTLEAINAHVDGISHGKALAPMIQDAHAGGQGTLFYEWLDGDWVAWERHPQRHELWRWVSSDAEAPATNKATEGAIPPAPPSDPVGASGHSEAPAGDLLPAGDGAQPTREELARTPAVACPGPATCVLCSLPVMNRELVHGARGWWAHHACATATAYTPPPAWGANEGGRLRQLREARGLSQKALAEKTSVSAGRISEAELGKRGLSLQVLEQVAQAVGVTLDVVLGKAAPLTRLQEELQRQVFEEPGHTLDGGVPDEEPGSALDDGPPDEEEPREAYAGLEAMRPEDWEPDRP